VGNRALRRAVFLDRDGVVNEPIVRDGKPYPPALDELHLVPHAAPSLEALHAAGYALLVVTNQPDIARGSRTAAEIGAIHARLADELPIDGFYVCPHDDDDRCTCRKPLPGFDRTGRARTRDRLGGVVHRRRPVEGYRRRSRSRTHDDLHRSRLRGAPTGSPADVTLTSLEGAAAWILNRQPA